MPRARGRGTALSDRCLLRRYQAYCRQLRTDPSAEVLVALQLGTTELRLTRTFDPASLLPLGEVLKTDTTITHLDLSEVRLEDSAAYVVRLSRHTQPSTPSPPRVFAQPPLKEIKQRRGLSFHTV